MGVKRRRRLLLIPFAVLPLVLGLAYLFGGDARTLSPSFATARFVGGRVYTDAPMRVWGIVFLCGFVCVAAALLSNRRWLIASSLFLGGALYSWWSVSFLISAFLDPRASATSWAVYGMVAFAYYIATWVAWWDPLRRSRS